MVKGCATYDPRVRVVGVVMNRVGSPRHRRLAGEAIEALGVTVVGSIPRLDALALPERHLGLVQAGELDTLDARLDAVADAVATHVDIGAVEALARPLAFASGAAAPAIAPPGQRIALARDAAFSFLYPHLMAGWRAAGAELRFFSPLADEPPPDDCDACWLPGGYPELHAGRARGRSRISRRSAAIRADAPRAWRMRGLYGPRRRPDRRIRRDVSDGGSA